MKTAIAEGKGLEVNTSCFRYGLKDLTPSMEILRLYENLGGEIITISSDSHEEAHLGCKIIEVGEKLKELEFQNVYTIVEFPVFMILYVQGNRKSRVWLPPPFHKREGVVRYDYISSNISYDSVWNVYNIAYLLLR